MLNADDSTTIVARGLTASHRGKRIADKRGNILGTIMSVEYMDNTVVVGIKGEWDFENGEEVTIFDD